MKTIVAATDFSDASLDAVNYAADLACLIQTDLLIVHVCAFPVVITAIPSYFTMEERLANAADQIEKLKDAVMARTKGMLKITTVVKQGDITEQINECCISQKTYAIVMGRTDMSVFERFILGSRTVAAVKKLAYPVITVPAGVQLQTIKNVGIACDFRNIIETLPVQEIKALFRELKATLHVLHVSNAADDAFSSRTIEQSAWFQELLGELTPRYHFIKAPDADRAIIELTGKLQLDLLIIIPKKHDMADNLFTHSHSRQLVLHAHVPVMSIHD